MLANRVREFTATVGTGDVALAGALPGHIPFSEGFSIGASVTYVIEDGDDYEIGTGTLASAVTLERTAVSETLVAGVYDKTTPAAISLSGNAKVYCAATAEMLLDPNLEANTISEASIDAGVTIDGVILKDGSVAANNGASFGGQVNIAEFLAHEGDPDTRLWFLPERLILEASGNRYFDAQTGGLSIDLAGLGTQFGGTILAKDLINANQSNHAAHALQLYDDTDTVSLSIGSDGNNVYLQSWASKPLFINGFGNDVTFGASNVLVQTPVGINNNFIMRRGTTNVGSLTGVFDGLNINAFQVLRHQIGGADKVTLSSALLNVLTDAQFDSGVLIGRSSKVSAELISLDYASSSQEVMAVNNTVDSSADSYLLRHYSLGTSVGQLIASNSTIGLRTSGTFDIVFKPGAMTALSLRGTDQSALFQGAVNIGNGNSIHSADYGNLLIGDFAGGNNGITIQTPNTGRGGIAFSDGNTTGVASRQGRFDFDHNTDTFEWLTADTVRLSLSSNILEMSGQIRGNSLGAYHTGAFDEALVTGDLATIGNNTGIYLRTTANAIFKTAAGGTFVWSETVAGQRMSLSNSLLDVSVDVGLSGNNITGADALVMTESSSIYRDSTASSVRIAGGNANDNGANIVLYGSTHATHANDLLFRQGTSNTLHYQSALNAWNFQSKQLTNVGHFISATGEIRRNNDTSAMVISGGSGTATGANVFFYGASHTTSANDILFRASTSNILGYGDASSVWNFYDNAITRAINVNRGVATSSITLSGGSNEVSGANVLLLGENHATGANDIVFRTGVTTRAFWDDSAAIWNFNGNNLLGLGDVTLDGNDIVRSVNTDVLRLSGSNSNSAGANIILWGDGATGNASDIWFRSGTTTRLVWDDSSGVWSFQGNHINGVASIARGTASNTMYLSGGTNTSLGANIILYGETEGTYANDIWFRSGVSNRLVWDASATRWSFIGTNVVDINNLSRSVGTSTFTVSGGSSGALGGGMTFYGETHATHAGDILFHNGVSNTLHYQGSLDRWNYQSKQLVNVGNIMLSGSEIYRANDTSYALLSGGTAGNVGGNLLVYGSTHTTQANDIAFRAGNTYRLHWNDDQNYWNFQGNNVIGFGGLYGDANTTALDIYADSSASGANVILYGSAHAMQANDILFRTGGTTRAQWDESAGHLDFNQNAIANTPVVVGVSEAGTIGMTGGASSTTGGRLVFFGSTHVTQANDMEFYATAERVLHWDNSAGRWDFQGKNVFNVNNIIYDGHMWNVNDTTHFTLSGGNNTGSGSNINLYGGTHTSNANDIIFRAGGITIGSYDHSGGTWHWGNNNLNSIANVTIGGSKVNVANLPIHADDTAAGTAGLAAGDIYRTSTGELRCKI